MNHPEVPADAASTPAEAEAPRRRRWLRWTLGAVAALLLVTAFAGPTLIAWVARSAIENAAAARGYQVAMGEVVFTWGSGLRVDGLAAREERPHGTRLTVAQIEIGPRWRDLVRGRLGFGRFRLLRPHLILDTARRPDPPKQPGSKRPDGGEPPADARSKPLALDLPLTVVDGVVEVRGRTTTGRPGIPGLRVEDLDVDGRIRGEEMRFTGAITGRVSSGPLREALHVEGDVALRGADGRPHGRAQFRAAGIDIGAVTAFFAREGRPGIESGRIEVEGELKAEGEHLTLTAHLVATDLVVATGRPDCAPIQEPSLDLIARARLFPQAERLEVKVEARGTDLGLDVNGWLRGRKLGAFDLSGSFAARLERAAPFLRGMDRLEGAGRGKYRVHGEAGSFVLDAGVVVSELVAAWPAKNAAGKNAAAKNTAGKNAAEGVTIRAPEAAAQLLARRHPDGRREAKVVIKSALMTLPRPVVRVEDLRIAARSEGERLELDSATARVNGGATTVRGGCDLAGESPRFSLTAETRDLELSSSLAELLVFVVPIYHVPKGVEAQLGGRVSGQCELAGPVPLDRPLDRNALVGKGTLQVDQGVVHGSALVAKLLSRLGGRDRYGFESLETRFRLANGMVHHETFRTRDRDLTWGFKGATGLDGSIDYRLDPGPIVERIYRRKEKKESRRGWEKILQGALGSLAELPIGLRGTLDRPEFQLNPVALKNPGKAPGTTPEAVPGKPAGEVAKEVVGGLLDDLLRRKKERDEKKRAKKREKKKRKQEQRAREKAAREKQGSPGGG